ncbi:hypothetical protein TNCV_3564251 [Trichonephila clavipes]|nr:hypothetical protein TNCV_3564251 [Trichonephila clavipes]
MCSTGDKSGERAAMEESENDVGSLEQPLLYEDEHYLTGKLRLGDHVGKKHRFSSLDAVSKTTYFSVVCVSEASLKNAVSSLAPFGVKLLSPKTAVCCPRILP